MAKPLFAASFAGILLRGKRGIYCLRSSSVALSSLLSPSGLPSCPRLLSSTKWSFFRDHTIPTLISNVILYPYNARRGVVVYVYVQSTYICWRADNRLNTSHQLASIRPLGSLLSSLPRSLTSRSSRHQGFTCQLLWLSTIHVQPRTTSAPFSRSNLQMVHCCNLILTSWTYRPPQKSKCFRYVTIKLDLINALQCIVNSLVSARQESDSSVMSNII